MVRIICAVICFFFLISSNLFAEESGQIININQNYKIAFTDLGSRILKQGDIVKIFLSTDEFIFMQVLESSNILTKLGTSQLEAFRTNLKDFSRITIGNKVIKYNQIQEDFDNTTKAAVEVKNINESYQPPIEKSEQDLSVAREEIKRLKEINTVLQERLDQQISEKAMVAQSQVQKVEVVPQVQDVNQEVLDNIKIRLNNIKKIINEKD